MAFLKIFRFHTDVMAQRLKNSAELCHAIRGLCFMLTLNYEKCPKNRCFSPMVPQNYQKLETPEHVALMEKLIDIMEDDDDVQNIWHNWEE